MDKKSYQNIPWVHSPFFEEIIEKDNASSQLVEFAKKYNKDGYVILENLLSIEECDKVISQTDTLFDQSKKDGAVSYYRYQDAWQKSPAVKTLASHPRVIEMLSYLYNRLTFPFQTLNFKFGSQQNAHSDCIHFSCIPSRFMCGVWVALEDIDAENGPLFYYPGSQALQECNLYDLGLGVDNLNYALYEEYQNNLMKSLGFEKKELHIKKGSALIWASNLVHGGTAIKDTSRTTYSQVTHYYFDNCVYYTPFYSNMITGELFVRTPMDISTGQIKENFYNDRKVFISPDEKNLSRIYFNNSILTSNKRITAKSLAKKVLSKVFR